MSSLVELLAQRLSQRRPDEIDLPVREQAAVAVILAPTPDSEALELLLIQRSSRADDPWSGHMALPGGRRDPGDVDLCATAVREAREETGVDLRDARLLGRLDDLSPIRQSERSLAVRPFVYWAMHRPELSLSEEVAEVLWIPLTHLRAAATDANVHHRGVQLRVSAYVIDGRVVWGLTQRVLAALLTITDKTD